MALALTAERVVYERTPSVEDVESLHKSAVSVLAVHAAKDRIFSERTEETKDGTRWIVETPDGGRASVLIDPAKKYTAYINVEAVAKPRPVVRREDIAGHPCVER